MSILRNKIRIAQTQGEFNRLQTRVDEWLETRTAADRHGQYSTQLKVLGETLNHSLEKLRIQVDGISPSGESGTVYRICQDYDQYLLWVQRVWEYYRNRFNQRDDLELEGLLAAADEIVWSCFHTMFPDPPPGTAGESPLRPAPLPYVEAFYSPQALNRPPHELQSADASPEFLKKLDAYLKQLPVPMVGLPPSCVRCPWWLVYLGHEVGHHVQREACAEEPFAGLLLETLTAPQPEAAEGTAHLPKTDPVLDWEAAERWAGWGNEIFADVFSLLMLGPPAYYAMYELETGDDLYMLTERRPRYPSPVVRLGLMNTALAELQIPQDHPLYDADLTTYAKRVIPDRRSLPLQSSVAEDLEALPKVVQAILTRPVGNLGFLPAACGWDPASYAPGGAVFNWNNLLRGPIPPQPEPRLAAARQIISGAVLAWTQLATLEDDLQRQEGLARLVEYLLPTLQNSREPGTRAGPPESQPTLPEENLADLLLKAGPGELGEV